MADTAGASDAAKTAATPDALAIPWFADLVAGEGLASSLPMPVRHALTIVVADRARELVAREREARRMQAKAEAEAAAARLERERVVEFQRSERDRVWRDSLSQPVISIAVTVDGGAAVNSDGRLWRWGAEALGEGIEDALAEADCGLSSVPLPDGVAPVPRYSWHPAVPDSAAPIREVLLSSFGVAHARDQDGGVWIWHGEELWSAGPYRVSWEWEESKRPRFVSLAGGKLQFVGLDRDGHVWTWGSYYWRGEDAFLGFHPTFSDRPTRVDTTAITESVVQVVATDTYFAALDAAGNVWTWGYHVRSLSEADRPRDYFSRWWREPQLLSLPRRESSNSAVKGVFAVGRGVLMLVDAEGSVAIWDPNWKTARRAKSGTQIDSDPPIVAAGWGRCGFVDAAGDAHTAHIWSSPYSEKDSARLLGRDGFLRRRRGLRDAPLVALAFDESGDYGVDADGKVWTWNPSNDGEPSRLSLWTWGRPNREPDSQPERVILGPP